MKIFIIHNWSDYNRGDSAILIGMLNYIKQNYNNVEYVTISPIDHDGYEKSQIYLDEYKVHYPFKIIGPIPPFSLYKKTNNSVIKGIQLLKNILLSILFLMLPKLSLGSLNPNKEFCNSINDADVVFTKGGHIFFAKSNKDLVRTFRDSLPIILAKRLNKKVVLGAQSIGPFKTFLTRCLVKKTLNSANSILCREYKTINYLESLDIKSEFKYFPDFAFFTKQISFDSKKEFTTYNDFIGLTLRSHNFNISSEEEYLEGFRFIIENLISRGEKCLIIPHCIGPTEMENDRNISEKLFQMLKNEEYFDSDKIKIFSETSEVHTLELLALYGRLKAVIGTRFHSVIFTLIHNTPAYSISYNGPKANIMDIYSLGEYMIDIEEVGQQKSKILTDFIKLLDNLPSYQQNISKVNKIEYSHFIEKLF